MSRTIIIIFIIIIIIMSISKAPKDINQCRTLWDSLEDHRGSHYL